MLGVGGSLGLPPVPGTLSVALEAGVSLFLLGSHPRPLGTS